MLWGVQSRFRLHQREVVRDRTTGVSVAVVTGVLQVGLGGVGKQRIVSIPARTSGRDLKRREKKGRIKRERDKDR